ncbi:2,4-dienoyl-CoA reductase-like NADH-dependent reductase (Old Yellow Enzyme family) [Caulobacter ginsengisoli]|uniref:2,4-dienoyl-CoA reductase-like NADH-dependent reductase (Old Yellow Enzyme family) n=1 Tax=Caulobacter ginsengisoli TaxID=400775 RepID=A0ABU0ISK3_9CAUL|nr:NADH:flavin oxidoreductase [Caulobacter ginsengisoli]MDQ0464997.1 2,4-dienoyl-CoA reductase-like NADH-dependent reductase (Old Yellow Enzyme family) [Caulobacter ginsengisoli]
MTDPFTPLTFKRGPAMKNRFMLAPLTNLQSHPDGRLSDDEFRWLTKPAEGGFGLTMTCAAHVQAVGQGFPGQLGVFSDDHLEGLTRLAAAIKAAGSVAALQMHHAGNRSPKDLVGQPVCPSDDAETGARALTTGEVEALVESFVAAAVRAQTAGFDGVEIHGAHGYILAQFLSAEVNRREDRYGGSLENRARVIREIIAGVRARCRPDFQLGLRLSPERFGLKLAEIRDLAGQLMAEGGIDYLDMSLWDVGKEPVEEDFKGRTLMSWFTELDRHGVRLGVAGKITSAAKVAETLSAGADYVLIGRAAIVNHDFPRRVAADPAFGPTPLPVTREHLAAEGLGPAFITYMSTWPGFVAVEEAATA